MNKSNSSRSVDGDRTSDRSRSRTLSHHRHSITIPAYDHPLNDFKERKQKEQVVIASTEVSPIEKAETVATQSSLSSIAFKNKEETNHNTYHASPGKSKTSTKKSMSARTSRRHVNIPSSCSRNSRAGPSSSSITDAEKTIIELKLELAQAKSVIDKQAYKNDELLKQNRHLRRKIDRCETEAEINKISSENLENATYEIEQLLVKNRRLQDMVDSTSFERDELKKELGLFRVSQPSTNLRDSLSEISLSSRALLGLHVSSDIDQHQSGHDDNNSVENSDRRSQGMQLLSNFRSSFSLTLGKDKEQKLSPNALLWDSDDDDLVQSSSNNAAA